MRNFEWMRSYSSPFKLLVPKFYIGRVAVGTPYFFPRRWIINKEKPGYKKPIPKLIGFDFVSLGWKTKFDQYRHEWNPVWSFVFFGWQIAITFVPPHDSHYWECWLYYYYDTDKSKSTKERLEQARKEYPCTWTTYSSEKKAIEVCYWDKILKKNR